METSCPNPAVDGSAPVAADVKVYLEIEKRFLVSPYNERESFEQFLYILELMPWFKSNGYPISLPSHPVFKDLEKHPENIKTF